MCGKVCIDKQSAPTQWVSQDKAAANDEVGDIKAMKKGALDASANHLQLTCLILQSFDLQIKARMTPATDKLWVSYWLVSCP